MSGKKTDYPFHSSLKPLHAHILRQIYTYSAKLLLILSAGIQISIDVIFSRFISLVSVLFLPWFLCYIQISFW